MGPTEIRANDVAEALKAQSDALDAQAAAKRSADPTVQVAVTRPGDEPTAAERRQWALAKAVQDGLAILRPGGRPKEHRVYAGPEGAMVARSEAPMSIVWGPDTAAAAEATWTRLVTERENELLIRAYGERQCRRAGLLL